MSTSSKISSDQPPLIKLIENGHSEYRITIAKEAPISEQFAANELQTFLHKITGVKLPIITDDHSLCEPEIIIGINSHAKALCQEQEFQNLGQENFFIQTKGKNLLIFGGKPRGTLYGVYSFLEEILGCRFFSIEEIHIPKTDRVAIPQLNIFQTPILEYREVFYHDALHGDWAARNKLNGSMSNLQNHHGGKISYFPFVHSFYELAPPDKFFLAHPEWFSLVDGIRTYIGRFKRAQLCLTNQELIQHAIYQVEKWIEEHPEVQIISISQNDGPGGWCECTSCTELAEKEGGALSAPIIYFVNKIAEIIGNKYPHVAIDTLAYSYSRKAPRSLKPLPNVIVRLTTGACCSHPIADQKCSLNAPFREDLENWSKLTDRIYIWDYVTNFYQYLLPFPNLHTLAPNISFFINTGVKGIFEQGSGDVTHSDMAPLKTYLLAKLLWNPNYDRTALTKEFLNAYYGAASEPILGYIELLEEQVVKGDHAWFHMSPFERSSHPNYLHPEVCQKATDLLNEAEHAVYQNEELLLRVLRLRLSLDYVKLQTAAQVFCLAKTKGEKTHLLPWFEHCIGSFITTAETTGVKYIRESTRAKSSLSDYRKTLESYLVQT